MSKIAKSEYADFISDIILYDKMSLGELEKQLHKKGFRVSKSTLATYAKELKASTNLTNESDKRYSAEIQDIKSGSKDIDYKKSHKEKRRLLHEMYDMALNNAYKVTKKAIENGKVLPTQVYKSVREIQNLLEGQNKLIKGG